MRGMMGLGQLPQPSGNAGANPVRYSSEQVTSQGDCAAKQGILFDQQRYCCVKINPETGRADPMRTHDYGWFCAQTTFGAPVSTIPGQSPYAWGPNAITPGPFPPASSSASLFGPETPSWLPIAIIGGLVAVVALSRRRS